jgi:hypothetical protein
MVVVLPWELDPFLLHLFVATIRDVLGAVADHCRAYLKFMVSSQCRAYLEFMVLFAFLILQSLSDMDISMII